MRKSLTVFLALALAAAGSVAPAAAAKQQGGVLNGVAQGADKAPLPAYRVQVRNANTGELVAATLSNDAGEFSFVNLTAGNYVVEIVDAAGKVIGLSPSIAVAAGANVTVTVSASAAGAIAASSGGGFNLFGLGPLAIVAVAGAAGAAAIAAVVATHDGKIVVCHKSAGAVPQTIEIEQSARESYIAQGDTLGACPASPAR
jgi:hypothetical protein